MGENETIKPETDNQEKTDEEVIETSENKIESEENKDDSEDNKEAEKSEDIPKVKEEEEDLDPPVRKRSSDFARERIEKKNADKDLTEDENKDLEGNKVTKIVQDAIKPFVEKQMKEEDDKEVDNFLKENPDFKPYEAKARKYISHPTRKDVPIKEIFYSVAGDELLRMGALRSKDADKEAQALKTTGGVADLGEVKPVSELTNEEMEAKQEEVRKKL